MADGYGTGMSSRPVDLASPGLAFFNSAIQARKQEIDQHKLEATESEKAMLKAMDMKGLGEVAGATRDYLDKDISSFRQELIQKYQKSQGRLSSADRMWMEGRSADIQNNIVNAKNQLQALEKAKLMVTPDKWNSYDDYKLVGKELADAETAIAKGDKTVNPMNIVMSHFRQPTITEVLAQRYGNLINKVDREQITKVLGREATTKDLAQNESVKGIVDQVLNDPSMAPMVRKKNPDGTYVRDATGAFIADDQALLDAINTLIPQKTVIKPASAVEMGVYPGTGRSRGAGSGKEYTTEVFKVGDKAYGKGMSVTLKNKFYNPAGDSVYADTGEAANQTVDIGAAVRFNADPKDPAMVYSVKEPSVRTKNGHPLFVADKENSYTVEQIKKDPSLVVDPTMYGKYNEPLPPKIETMPDGGIKVIPRMKKDTRTGAGKFFGTKAEYEEVDLEPVVLKPDIDKEGYRQIITKVTPNNIGPVFDAIGRNALIDGEPAYILEDRIKKAWAAKGAPAPEKTQSTGFKLPGLK